MSEILSGCAVRAAIQQEQSGVVQVKVGQIWMECDPRVGRKVEILSVGREQVTIQTVGKNRKTFALLIRFNGKRGGYTYVSG